MTQTKQIQEPKSVSRKSTYAVYVADANGWDDGCPSSEDVFFGQHEGQFFRHAYDADLDIDLGSQGFVLVDGYREAVAYRNLLDSTGDWIAPTEINPDEEKTRPTYAIRKVR